MPASLHAAVCMHACAIYIRAAVAGSPGDSAHIVPPELTASAASALLLQTDGRQLNVMVLTRSFVRSDVHTRNRCK